MLAMPGLPRLEWMGTLDYVPSRLVSLLEAQRIVGKGCEAYLAFVRAVSVDTPTVELFPIVRDYPDVFLTDHPSMPPDINNDFVLHYCRALSPFLIYRIMWPQRSWRSYRSSCKSCLIRGSFGLVCHIGVLRFYLWRKRMVLCACVLTIGSWTRLQWRTSIHCQELMTWLISYMVVEYF